MTQKEFVTGCVKLMGLVILVFGVLRFINHGAMAGTMYSTSAVMQKVLEDDQFSGSDDFKYVARVIEVRNRMRMNLLHLPFDLLQIGVGFCLCRREQRIVRFLLR